MKNSNLTPYSHSTYLGYPIYTSRGANAEEYLNRIYVTLKKATDCHARTMALRVDLRIPPYVQAQSEIISKFIASLKAKINCDGVKKANQGKRVHPCQLRYVWCKEQATAKQPHYHLVLLLNKDRYYRLGVYDLENNDLFRMIATAWASALGIKDEHAMPLIKSPENAIYWLDARSQDFEQQFANLIYRVSYLAKLDTKNYGDKSHAFGCSRL